MTKESATYRELVDAVDKLRREMKEDRTELRTEMSERHEQLKVELKQEIREQLEPISQQISNMDGKFVLKQDFVVVDETVRGFKRIILSAVITVLTTIIGAGLTLVIQAMRR